MGFAPKIHSDVSNVSQPDSSGKRLAIKLYSVLPAGGGRSLSLDLSHPQDAGFAVVAGDIAYSNIQHGEGGIPLAD